MKQLFLVLSLFMAFNANAVIRDNEVTTSKIKDAAVTAAKLASGIFTKPTQTTLTSTGTRSGAYFVVTSANATVGATYTNNSQTFTVLATIAGSTRLFTSGTGAPQSSGTLTKASGTGDSTITFSSTIALATYTKPAAATYLEILMVGAGGSGNGGSAGTATLIAPSFIANGGTAGAAAQTAGVGGTVFLDDVPGTTYATGFIGSSGGMGAQNTNDVYGMGGPSPFGGNGGQNQPNAAANSGSGGGGQGSRGGGGGSGGFIRALVTSPASTLYYAIGVKGSGASADGGDGIIIIKEFYQ